MKVGILVSSIDEEAGGAHTLTSNLLSTLENWNTNKTGFEISLILSGSEYPKNRAELVNGMGVIRFPNIHLQRLIRIGWLVKHLYLSLFQGKKVDFRDHRSAVFNRLVSKHGLKLIWSTEPLSFPLDVPYINTVWDIAHRTSPYFPEVSSNFQWHVRESNNTKAIQRAYLNVVGTQVGADELVRVYGITRDRILVNPFPVPNILSTSVRKPRVKGTFFYPAQFWPHKNHATLIRAMQILKERTDFKVNLTLTGSDKGNLDYIKTMIDELNLRDSVDLVGFVSEDRLNDLYATCGLFVFPSLIGPDNLPPLEAIAYGAPMLISRFPGSVEQIGDAAKYFDPLDADELANLMLLSIEHPEEWLENQKMADGIRASRRYDEYLNCLFAELGKLSTLRAVWP